MAVLKLSDALIEKIWQGEFWGPDGALYVVRRLFVESSQDFPSQVQLLSTEYSAANRAWANLRQGKDRRAGYRLVDSALRARKLASQLAPGVSIHTNADQVDVIATILTRFWQRKLARQLLDRIPWYELLRRDYVASHTKAFLVRHAIASGLAELSHERITQIEFYARVTEDRADYRQAARVWRTAYELKRRLAKKEGRLAMYEHKKLPELRANAQRCLDQAPALDQQAKLDASP